MVRRVFTRTAFGSGPADAVQPGVARGWQESLGPLILGLWGLALLLVPYYLWSSGRPQIADFIFAALGAFILLSTGPIRSPVFRQLFGYALAFAVYALVINFIYLMIYREQGFFFSGLFYLFNVLVLHLVLRLYELYGRRMVEISLHGLVGSLFVQLVLARVLAGYGSRDALFFNNPNQLAYYSLAVLAAIGLLVRVRKRGELLFWVSALGAAYLALVSLSRSGLLGVGVALVVFSAQRVRSMIIVALLGTVAMPWFLAHENVEYIERRFERDEDLVGESQAEIRGYDRIWRFPEYLVAGAGEGAHWRFYHEWDKSREIHSSLGAVLFGYGILGFSLLAWFLWSLFARGDPRLAAFMLPSLAYGVHHQGLRSRVFWITLGLILVGVEYLRRAHAEGKPQPGQPATKRTPWVGGGRTHRARLASATRSPIGYDEDVPPENGERASRSRRR